MGFATLIPKNIRDLVDDGTITVHIDVSRNGEDVWCRSVQPHPGLGILTNQSMTFDEVLATLGTGSRYKGKTTFPLINPALQKVSQMSEASARQVVSSLEDAQNRAALRNLMVLNRGGVANALPSDSLTWWDIGREDYDDFVARAFLVASKLGNQKLRARIETSAELRIDGCGGLEKWWFLASPGQRWSLLTTSSKRGNTPKTCLEGLKSSYKNRLALLPCPFRGSENLQTQKEDKASPEESDSDEYDYTGGSAY